MHTEEEEERLGRRRVETHLNASQPSSEMHVDDEADSCGELGTVDVASTRATDVRVIRDAVDFVYNMQIGSINRA